MLEKVDEQIEVSVNFSEHQVWPVLFKWRGQVYHIDKLNLVHKERSGNDKIYYFSVSDEVNFFRLAFFTADLSWRLEELYYEG